MHAKRRWRLQFGSRFIEGVNNRAVLVIEDRTAASRPLSTNKNVLVFQELLDKKQEKTLHRQAPLQNNDCLCRARVVVKC